MRAQFFHYKILEVKPIDVLHEFKDHDRLKVFYHKGVECVSCGRKATQIALGEEKKGKKKGLHWDLYDDSFYPLTVDHTIPKCRGGGEELENKQPMCFGCNQKKGGRLPGEIESYGKGIPNLYSCIGHTCKYPRVKASDMIRICPKIGDGIYTKGSKKFEYRGIVEEIVINPYTNRQAAKIGNSMYHTDVVYIKK